MKKITLYLNFIIFSFNGYSQPILNASNFPTNYSANLFLANTNGFSNELPGVNVVWDYSTINITPRNFSLSTVNMNLAPFANQFPTANYGYMFNDNGYITYNYYKIDNNEFSLYGYVDGNSVINYSSNPSTFLTFPYTYNTDFIDSSQSNGSSEVFTVRRIYDAYGTLITPFGTYNNVIRQKEIGPEGTVYYWIATNPYEIVLTGNFDNQTVFFFQNTTLNTIENTNEATFSIFPNPFDNSFNLKCSKLMNNNNKLYVYDSIGKLIIQNDLTDCDLKVIELNECNDGLFLVVIKDTSNTIVYSKKILKK